nr:MAG TPA: hypothetical protein [Caudoviricetes sp.]
MSYVIHRIYRNINIYSAPYPCFYISASFLICL